MNTNVIRGLVADYGNTLVLAVEPGLDAAGLAVRLTERGVLTVYAADGQVNVLDAAEFLHVPVAYLIKLAEAGDLPSTGTGFGRLRFGMTDLVAYRAARDERRSAALDELARLGQADDYGQVEVRTD